MKWIGNPRWIRLLGNTPKYLFFAFLLSFTFFLQISTYLDDVFSIPWQKYTMPFWDINHAKTVMDKNIFGLQKVKERIYELIAVKKKTEDTTTVSSESPSPIKKRGFVILIYGPPGTGKTSIAKCIGSALKRPCRFISFSGVNDPSFIKGHKRTYVDSQAGSLFPLFFLMLLFFQEYLSKSSSKPEP